MSYQTTTNSPTLGHRTVGTAEDLSLDPTGGRWVVICETHGTIVNTTTLADARATATAEFCEDCMFQWMASLPTPDEVHIRRANRIRKTGA